jgi:hypothetical protein
MEDDEPLESTTKGEKASHTGPPSVWDIAPSDHVNPKAPCLPGFLENWDNVLQ